MSEQRLVQLEAVDALVSLSWSTTPLMTWQPVPSWHSDNRICVRTPSTVMSMASAVMKLLSPQTSS